MTLIMAVGGSTNAVLHLLAMARTAKVPLALDDFQRESDRVPLLADLKPSGRTCRRTSTTVGGTPARDEVPPGQGVPAWRRDDGHRQDAGGEPSRTCPT